MLCTNIRSILSVCSFLNDPSNCSRAVARSSLGHALGGEEELVARLQLGEDAPEGLLGAAIPVRRVDDLPAEFGHPRDDPFQAGVLLGRVLAPVDVGAEPDDGHALAGRRDGLGDELALLRVEPGGKRERTQRRPGAGDGSQLQGVASSHRKCGVGHVSASWAVENAFLPRHVPGNRFNVQIRADRARAGVVL
jgi:hypothetical protein